MAWIDLTFRPEEEPEMEVTPSHEFELSWSLPDGGRLTILVPRAVMDKVTTEARSLLEIIP